MENIFDPYGWTIFAVLKVMFISFELKFRAFELIFKAFEHRFKAYERSFLLELETIINRKGTFLSVYIKKSTCTVEKNPETIK